VIKIHPIQTGLVRIRVSQRNRKPGGPLRILFDRVWTEWLPIHVWAIEHPEGIILVDTGETSRITEPGYLPSWHPFYRLAASFDVKPADEIGPQLRKLGISPDDVRTVIITHLHTDHAGGLHHFPRSRIFVADGEYRNALGLWGKLNGYLPHRWPEWFAPVPIPFTPAAFGGFAKSFPVTTAGDVVVVIISSLEIQPIRKDNSSNDVRMESAPNPKSRSPPSIGFATTFHPRQPSICRRTILTAPSGCAMDKSPKLPDN
jgi:glyoxylase-like metal-dependent hydrolase (beta-lactamase superfamily II)